LAIFAAALAFSASPRAHAQDAPTTNLCCGVVSPEGQRLDHVIDSMHVDQLWQAHVHINWETGEQDMPATYTGPDRATHCSSFTASLGEKLGVYLLRPPQHPQQLLASAQAEWFHSKDGVKAGWTAVATPAEAQTLANQGELVMVVYESPDSHKPGHIAVIRPFPKTPDDLAANGPETAQAGAMNFSNGVARVSFAHHEDAWPNGVRYYAHSVNWSAIPAANQSAATH
jgi:hypothetical protein